MTGRDELDLGSSRFCLVTAGRAKPTPAGRFT